MLPSRRKSGLLTWTPKKKKCQINRDVLLKININQKTVSSEFFKKEDNKLAETKYIEDEKEFAEKNGLKYTLLSDTRNIVRKLFGVPGKVFGLIPGRVTYVIDRSGKVVYIFDSQTETQRHADEALKICLLLKRTDVSKVNQKS